MKIYRNTTIYISQRHQQRNKDIRQVFMHSHWDPDRIYRDICALANSKSDHCGYILIGAQDDDCPPPPVLTRSLIAAIKSDMVTYNAFIKPALTPKLYLVGTAQKPVAMIIIKPSDKGPYVVPEKVSEGAKNYRRYLPLGQGIIAI